MKYKYNVFLAIAIFIIVILLILYLSPLLDGIVMGIAFAYVAKPLKNRFSRKISVRLSSLIATLLITVPLFIFFFYGLFQGINQLILILSNYNEVVKGIIDTLKNFGVNERYLREIENIMPKVYSIISQKISLSAIDITSKFIFFVLNFLISSIVCYYVLLDGERFLRRLILFFPQEDREKIEEFAEELDKTYTGLWFGNFIVAMLIGFASIPFFLYFGIPYAPLLSGLMFLAAIIPLLAEWMILIPIALYLITIDIYSAIWFISIGVVFLYVIPELIIRPYFVGYTSKVHPLILMLAFIGGAVFGGISGFFIAPMIAGAVTALYNYYSKTTSPAQEQVSLRSSDQ